MDNKWEFDKFYEDSYGNLLLKKQQQPLKLSKLYRTS
jgi:hypothetical protein